MKAEPGDMFMMLAYGNGIKARDEHVYILVKKKRDDSWVTFNLCTQKYEWDYESALFKEKLYKRLA